MSCNLLAFSTSKKEGGGGGDDGSFMVMEEMKQKLRRGEVKTVKTSEVGTRKRRKFGIRVIGEVFEAIV